MDRSADHLLFARVPVDNDPGMHPAVQLDDDGSRPAVK